MKEESTSEMRFPTGNKAEYDYHKMDGDIFMHQVEGRFVPAFCARYPCRERVLILVMLHTIMGWGRLEEPSQGDQERWVLYGRLAYR